jgi:hypothetical protein
MIEVTRNIVDLADEGDAKNMRDALYAAIQDRVMAHIDSHKQSIAKTLIAPEESEDSTDAVENA